MVHTTCLLVVLFCCVVLLGKQQKLKDLGDGGKMKHRVAELQSQVSKLEQENYQLKRRSAKPLEEVSERSSQWVLSRHVQLIRCVKT